MEEYKSLETQAMKSINNNMNNDYDFSWRNIVEEAIEKRKCLNKNFKCDRKKSQSQSTKILSPIHFEKSKASILSDSSSNAEENLEST